MKFQVFRSGDDFFVVTAPAGFQSSEDKDGNVFVQAETIEAEDEAAALAEAELSA